MTFKFPALKTARKNAKKQWEITTVNTMIDSKSSKTRHNLKTDLRKILLGDLINNKKD
jgi:hypothetical protein